MLRFKRLDSQEGILRYGYYPEGGESFGVIAFDIKEGQGKIESLEKADVCKIYAYKMLGRVRKMAVRGVFESEGTISWY